MMVLPAPTAATKIAAVTLEIKDSEAIQYVGKIVLCPCGRLLFIVQETCGPHDEAPPSDRDVIGVYFLAIVAD